MTAPTKIHVIRAVLTEPMLSNLDNTSKITVCDINSPTSEKVKTAYILNRTQEHQRLKSRKSHFMLLQFAKSYISNHKYPNLL